MSFFSRFRKSRTQPLPRLGDAGGRGGASAETEATNAERTDHRRHGDALLAAGAHEAALEAYQAAIDSADDGTLAHLGQGRTYIALGRLEDAVDSLEVAIALDPMCVDALGALAEIRLRTGAPAEAVRLLRRAIEKSPDRGDLHFSLALGLNRCGDTAAAMAAYLDAIRWAPGDPGPRVNLGLIHLQQLGQPAQAEAEFRLALALAPGHLGAIANLGLALNDLGRHDDAQHVYRQGLAMHPDSVELRWNLGISNLSAGRFAAGWEDFELRLRRPGGRDLRRFDYPEWDGAPLGQGRLLILAEQGLGDEIMFGSCIPDLQAVAGGIVLECAPRLASLFKRSFPWAQVHGVERHAPADWLDRYPDILAKRPIGGLPRLLRPALDSFPVHAGYLRADPDRVAEYRRRLQAQGNVRHVGLSWRGGTRATRGEMRSMAIEQMQVLHAVPNVRYVCLQHDITDAEREFARNFGMVVPDEIAADIDAAAALITALDAVVSVPNTNAHLSGALGKRVWVLLNAAPDWRWQAAGARSPWYPSAVLVRATLQEGWARCLAEVRSDLEALAGASVASASC